MFASTPRSAGGAPALAPATEWAPAPALAPTVRTAAALLGALFAVLLAVANAATPLARAQELVFDSGHVDAFYVSAPDGELTLALKEDITGQGVIHPGDDVILRVVEDAWSDATESIGEIGAPTYYLPQTQVSSIIWPGWDTQQAKDGGFTDVDLEFVEIAGPGAVYAFETAGFGETRAVNTAGALELISGDVINQPYPAHRHVNWAFSAPGTYTMTVRAVSNGTASNTVTYTWDVGDGGAHDSASTSDGEANSQAGATGAGGEAADGSGAGSAGERGGATGAAAGGASASSGERGTKTARTSADKEKGSDKDPKKADSRTQRSARGSGTASAGEQEYYYAEQPKSMLPWGVGLAGLGMLAMGLAIARLALAKARE